MSELPADNAFAPVHRLAAEIGAGKLSPVDLVESCLARIEKYDNHLHAFVTVYADEARLAAEASAEAIQAGQSLGPLHGIPVAVKDLLDIEGRITTGGSKAWRERVSPVTATLVRRLLAAGMIVIGKTHTVEFAFGGWGTNQYNGVPWNPWDLNVHRVPGGSSSGSGVAVAAGLCPVGIGSDTGGSVRLPSAFCGLVGLKTTVGRISLHGVLPLSPTLDTLGPLVRSVEDAALMLQATQGPDTHDPRTLVRPIDDPLQGLRRGVAGMRLAALTEEERDGIDGEVLAAYDASLRELEWLGAQVAPLALPGPIRNYRDAVSEIISAEGYALLDEMVERDDLPLDENVRQRLLAGKALSAKDYILALRDREQAKQAFAEAITDVDALLTPTTSQAAIPVAEVDEAKTPANLTRFVNLLDLCALTVPNGYTAGGMPTALQIVGRGYAERTVLRIGWAFEQATLGRRRTPAGLS